MNDEATESMAIVSFSQEEALAEAKDRTLLENINGIIIRNEGFFLAKSN